MGFWSLDEWKKPPPPVTGDRHEHVRIISPNNRDSHDRHFHPLPLYFQNMHFRSSQTPLLCTHAKSFSSASTYYAPGRPFIRLLPS